MNSTEFDRLDTRVQRWVFKQGWSDLRDIQKAAISPILGQRHDVVISAATASGKTEAFFLPACSAISEQKQGFGIMYVSPLKALINDQYRRLEGLCDMLEMELTPWHGDSPQSKKNRAKRDPSGILLITPESLESMLMRHAGWVAEAFVSLQYIVIDEFHAFIGMERGYQLLSILNRLEVMLGRQKLPIPRVALSATLGELAGIPSALRPNGSMPAITITSDTALSNLQLQVRGYIDPAAETINENNLPADTQICQDLYQICRGDSHLIFANSRRRTEMIASNLTDLCEQAIVPNEFFPHHGSLSKDLRESLESRLQKETLPTTAVCTSTLELGIDIGKVKSVAQVTAPHSVASLRQRLGRSGRRGDPAVLRLLIAEDRLNVNSNIVDRLRLELLQSIAMTRLLMVEHWYEPPDRDQYHFSTLLHQVLATISQWGGVRIEQLYAVLCESGPFSHVTVIQFKQLLSHMGEKQLITQLGSGELTLGIEGERVSGHYTFYAVFKTPEEYRVIAGGKTLGSIPIESLVMPGQHIVFAGRRWLVKEVLAESKTIMVVATKGGQPPRFGGEGMSVHDRVRQEMYAIYLQGDYRIGEDKVDFLDQTARDLFREGHSCFQQLGLEKQILIQQGSSVTIIPWRGDKLVNTLAIILVSKGYNASTWAGSIEVLNTTVEELLPCLHDLAQQEEFDSRELAKLVPDTTMDKFDEWLPQTLLEEGYGRKKFDTLATLQWLKEKFSKVE